MFSAMRPISQTVSQLLPFLRLRGKGLGRRSVSRIGVVFTLALVALGPILAFLTFAVVGPLASTTHAGTLRAVLLLDVVYILIIAGLVLIRVARMIAAQRAKSAGSRLHMRLTAAFSVIALVPTILVAVFATITISMGLEGWFSQRVSLALGNSVRAAQAYAQEHRDDLIEDSRGLAGYLNVAKQATFFLDDGDLRQLLSQGQEAVQRGLAEAYVIDGSGQIRARGDRSYLFDFEPATEAQMLRARSGEAVLIEDQEINEFRVIFKLQAFTDRYLYVTRSVDGDILRLLDETEATVRLYRELESERGRTLFGFGVLYIGFALILIFAAIWAGLLFAERLARPVGRLAGAAQRVGSGDLDVRVPEQKGDDEIAMLGRLFNQMTRQLKSQRASLIATNMQTEVRRRLFDSVLSSVTAGVIGLDPDGEIEVINTAALSLLSLTETETDGVPIGTLVPEFTELFETLKRGTQRTVQQELRLMRGGRLENLMVQIARRRSVDEELEGFVVTFDDVTDLVSAQRMAAWGDVARRIAHEIKNPLTPIQLSAERVKRKFAPMLNAQEAQALTEYSDVIIRQTNDLRRIVDEFSKFARMPEPICRSADFQVVLNDIIHLQDVAHVDITFQTEISEEEFIFDFDETMIGQALTNCIKNAAEAIETKRNKSDTFEGIIQIQLTKTSEALDLRIQDSGIGFPQDRAKLFEPYVTTRDKGTGLGLPIVKKIIDEHGGQLSLHDAPVLGGNRHQGAEVRISLPLTKTKGPGFTAEPSSALLPKRLNDTSKSELERNFRAAFKTQEF